MESSILETYAILTNKATGWPDMAGRLMMLEAAESKRYQIQTVG